MFKKSICLTQRQLCDLEMILNGGFYPLEGFLAKKDYESVVENMRLSNGVLWPIPICLDLDDISGETIAVNDDINLCDNEGNIIASMQVTDKWRPDKKFEAQHIYGCLLEEHYGVNYLLNSTGNIYIGGKVTLIQKRKYYDFNEYRNAPSELALEFKSRKWERVVGFQTRNPMHRAHFELTLQAMKVLDANLLLQPSIGETKSGDIDYYTRVKCYQKIVPKYPQGKVILNLLPLAMRMAGPREALWHAIIRKNYGCTHFIVGRDHAGAGKNKKGVLFHDPYEAQKLAQEYQDEIKIKIVAFEEMVYVENKKMFLPLNSTSERDSILSLSGTEFRKKLLNHEQIPEWFSFKEVVEVLKTNKRRGLTIFFTGLSGSGKSTLAKALLAKIKEMDTRYITVLDGDEIRKVLCSELGFSKEHRNINVARIGFVAKKITECGGIAICAQIAPYKSARKKIRDEISAISDFVEIYVSTSLEVCESRDIKGLYAKARKKLITSFTGIDDRYELPTEPEIIINTENSDVDTNVNQIINTLINNGYINVDLSSVKTKYNAKDILNESIS